MGHTFVLNNRNSCCLFSIIFSTLLVTTIFCNPSVIKCDEFLDSNNINHSDTSSHSGNTSNEFGTKPTIEKTNLLSYVPVESTNKQGNNFTITDSLTVSHPFSLILNSSNGNSSSFDITGITDYNADSLQYNITVKSSKEFYTVEDFDKKNQKLDGSHVMIAQGFEITWDYAGFSGAKLFLDVEGPSLGSDEIELYVVSENITDGLPDLTDVRSTEIDGPYNSSHMFPTSTSGNFAYFNFTYAVLERGNYFLVVNKTSDDGGDDFIWWANDNVDNFDTYKYDPPEWKTEGGRDYTLILELVETDQDGYAKIFSSPENVYLQDNSLNITSFSQVISSTGLHTLTANNSVEVICNNSYIFTRDFIATSSCHATNSSYYDYSISWNVEWFSPLVNFTPYSSPFRINSLITPNDWDNISFLFFHNASIDPHGYRSANGYVFDLVNLVSNNRFFESNITLTTTSPNYIFDYLINAESFNLGYWSFNGSHAEGHEGSLISSNLFIKERVDKFETTGELNFTLFDTNGKIVNKKLGPFTNISYIDTTDYSLVNSTQVSPGIYSIETYFDPSINNSDTAGYWTLSYFWNNGTEAGFFSKRIVTHKPTSAEFEWETLPESDIWTNSTSLLITRLNGEELNLNVSYYNISEPFFDNNGHVIKSASIYYDTDWSITDFLDFQTSSYNGSILATADADYYSIQITATGQFLVQQTVQFNLRLLHQFSIQQHLYEYAINFTNEAKISFGLVDMFDNDSVESLDQLILHINDSQILTDFYTYITSDDLVEVTIDIGALGLYIGNYEVNVTVIKENFVENINKEYTDSIFFLQITPIKTEIQLVTSFSEANFNSLIAIEFRFIDTNHSSLITGALFEIIVDNADVDVVSLNEIDGLYSVSLQINEPTIESVNVTLSISKNGFVSIENFKLASMKLTLRPEFSIPNYIFGIIGAIVISVLITLFIVLYRRKREEMKQIETKTFDKTYALYRSILAISKVMVVHENTGLPVYEIDFGSGIDQDPTLISGFFQAISQMGAEMRGDDSSIRSINYENFILTRLRQESFILYAFSDTELELDIENRLKILAEWFSNEFGTSAENWGGTMDEYTSANKAITDKVKELLHLWVLYPFKVSESMLKNINNLDSTSKKILKHIQRSEKSTLSKVFDELESIPIEKSLVLIFELMNKQYLEPLYDAYSTPLEKHHD